jgi:large subunit ribosomal protein L25
MAEFILNAEVRKKVGKSDAKKLRAAKKIPAVIYGKDISPTHIALSSVEFEKASRNANRNAIIEIKLDNSESKEVIVRDYQKHSITHMFTHVDFQAIHHEIPIRVDVDLEFTGSPIGKKQGGIFTTLCKQVRVESLPDKIPQVIKLDVTDIDAGDSLHVSDVKTGDFKILTSPKVALCQVSKVKEETETATAEDEEAATAEAAPAATAAEE